MKERFDHNRGESESRPEIEKFISGFEDVTLTNSDGKEIRLKVWHGKKPKRFEDDEDTETVTIDFENYEFHEAERNNHLGFIITPGKKEIYLSQIALSDPDLRGKRIYEKLMGIMAEHFPEGYSLVSTIEHEKTRDRAYDLFAQYEGGEIDESTLKNLLLKSGMLQSIRDNGFNDFKIIFHESVSVVAKKNPEVKDVAIEIGTDLLDES